MLFFVFMFIPLCETMKNILYIIAAVYIPEFISSSFSKPFDIFIIILIFYSAIANSLSSLPIPCRQQIHLVLIPYIKRI